MFDDILGKPVEKVRYDGEKRAESTSVGGVKAPIGMSPNRIPVGIGGLKGKPVPAPTAPPPPNILGGSKGIAPDDDDEPELELDLDFDDDDCVKDEDCDCEDCGSGSCQGCLDEDVWSAIA